MAAHDIDCNLRMVPGPASWFEGLNSELGLGLAGHNSRSPLSSPPLQTEIFSWSMRGPARPVLTEL